MEQLDEERKRRNSLILSLARYAWRPPPLAERPIRSLSHGGRTVRFTSGKISVPLDARDASTLQVRRDGPPLDEEWGVPIQAVTADGWFFESNEVGVSGREISTTPAGMTSSSTVTAWDWWGYRGADPPSPVLTVAHADSMWLGAHGNAVFRNPDDPSLNSARGWYFHGRWADLYLFEGLSTRKSVLVWAPRAPMMAPNPDLQEAVFSLSLVLGRRIRLTPFFGVTEELDTVSISGPGIPPAPRYWISGHELVPIRFSPPLFEHWQSTFDKTDDPSGTEFAAELYLDALHDPSVPGVISKLVMGCLAAIGDLSPLSSIELNRDGSGFSSGVSDVLTTLGVSVDAALRSGLAAAGRVVLGVLQDESTEIINHLPSISCTRFAIAALIARRVGYTGPLNGYVLNESEDFSDVGADVWSSDSIEPDNILFPTGPQIHERLSWGRFEFTKVPLEGLLAELNDFAATLRESTSGLVRANVTSVISPEEANSPTFELVARAVHQPTSRSTLCTINVRGEGLVGLDFGDSEMIVSDRQQLTEFIRRLTSDQYVIRTIRRLMSVSLDARDHVL